MGTIILLFLVLYFAINDFLDFTKMKKLEEENKILKEEIKKLKQTQK